MEKERLVKGLTVKVIVTWLVLHIIFFTIINIYGKGLLRTHTYITATRTGIPWYPPWGFYLLFLLIVIPISYSIMKRLPFSSQELAILFGLMVISLDTAIIMDTMSVGLWYRFIPQSAAVPSEFIPPFFAPPSKTTVEGMLLGKSSVPWGELMPFIAYWTAYFIGIFAFSIFLMEIFRKKFIEIDKLSYPAVMPSFEIIRMATTISSSESKGLPTLFDIKQNKWFWIGFFTLGLAFGIPSVLAYTFPELGIPPFACAGRFPIYPLADFFATNPWHIAGDARWVPTDCFLMFLVPMDILATHILYQFICYIIWPIIATSVGIMAPGVPASTYWTAAGPFRPLLFSASVLIGLGIWIPILAWRHIKDSLVKAFKVRETPEGDVPALWAWIGLIVSGILLFVLGLAIGINALIMFLTLLIASIIYIGRSYFLGEAWPIGYVGQTQTFLYGFVRHAGSALGIYPQAATLTQDSWGMGAWHFMTHQSWLETSVSTSGFPMPNYKLAAMTGTRPREMFNAMLLASVLIPLISVPLSLWLYYTWGVEKILTWYGPKSYQVGYVTTGLQGVITSFPYWDPVGQANIIAAIIITGPLLLLRLRFPWFFINPLGIAGTYVIRNTVEALPIFVIKFLMIKIGGAKVYERIGVPFFVGALVGLTFFVGIGLGILHFRTAAIAPPY
ncbi:MAG: DUF6785 family protein [Candidatus Bathyarchaeia archaeon]